MASPKPGRLSVRWSKREKDFVAGSDHIRQQDSGLLFMMLNERPWRNPLEPFSDNPERLMTYVQELKRRGYDITTLRFTIDKAKP